MADGGAGDASSVGFRTRQVVHAFGMVRDGVGWRGGSGRSSNGFGTRPVVHAVGMGRGRAGVGQVANRGGMAATSIKVRQLGNTSSCGRWSWPARSRPARGGGLVNACSSCSGSRRSKSV